MSKTYLFKCEVKEWVSLMHTMRNLSWAGGVLGGLTLNLITWGCRGPGVFLITSQAWVGFFVNSWTEIGSKIDIFSQSTGPRKMLKKFDSRPNRSTFTVSFLVSLSFDKIALFCLQFEGKGEFVSLYYRKDWWKITQPRHLSCEKSLICWRTTVKSRK